MNPNFDPRREAGDYTAPQGLYEQNKAKPFLGRLSCDQIRLVAGEWTELRLVYEVGACGLADGAWLKLAFKFYSDWALFQTEDPRGANFVSAEYQAGPLVPGQSAATVQQLKVRFDQKGHERPFQKALLIDVVDGYLNPGDRVVIRLGDRRHGGGGTRVQSFVEKDFRFRMFIDPLGSSKFAEVPGDCLLDIVAGAPSQLGLIAPRLVGVGEHFDVIVRLDDAWGNTCQDTALPGTLRLSGPQGERLEQPFELAAQGWAVARVAQRVLSTAGEWQLAAQLRHAHLDLQATAYVNAAVRPGLRPLYADLHVHSDDTIGTNDTSYNLSYGRDVAGLDILGYTANDFNITEARWNEAVALIHSLNEPGRFVCFPGTEWCGNSAAGGDRNIVFLGEGQPRFPFDDQGRLLRSFEWNEFTAGTIRPGAWPVDELYAAYADDPESHLMIPHVGGRRCNLDWHHPQLERLVEVGSAWGQFHWVYAEALARGYRVGASANSDEHQGRCGGGVPATAVFGSRGGLTGVLASRFDRQGVGQALRARRTFATTGERSFASLKLGRHWMGEVCRADGQAALSYHLLGDQGWEELRLFRGDECVWRRDLHEEHGWSDTRVRIRMGGARVKDRYRGAHWSGRIELTGSPVNAVRTFGFDHPEQSCWRDGPTALGFRTATHGDTDSIELTLGALASARIVVKARIDGYVKVGSPLKRQPFVHAPEVELSIRGEQLLVAGRIEEELPGTELRLSIERVTDQALPRELSGDIALHTLGLAAGQEHPLFLTARQRDQSRVWTSALFVSLQEGAERSRG